MDNTAKSISFDSLKSHLDIYITNVSNLSQLSSSLLYSEGSDCTVCTKYSRGCRGHIGYIRLKNYHVKYIYQDIAKNFCKHICDTCMLPIFTISKNITVPHLRVLEDLKSLYGRVCNCTGSSLQKDTLHFSDKILRIYNKIDELNIDTTRLRTIFKLGSRIEVLSDILPVIPLHLIEQLSTSNHIKNCYTKIIKDTTTALDIINEQNLLDSLYDKVCKSLNKKTGIIRQMVFPRKIPKSARGVIISDPYIDITSLGVSSYMASNLTYDIVLTSTNYKDIIECVHNNLATHIVYGDIKYKLYSNSIRIRLIMSNYISNTILDIGDRITTRDNIVYTYDNSNYLICKQLLDDRRFLYISKANNTRYPEEYIVDYYPIIDVVSREDRENIIHVPLMIGCTITTAYNNGKLLVHRNPVLSAGSLRMHYMKIYNTVSSTYLNQEEKRIQRVKNKESMSIYLDRDYNINKYPINERSMILTPITPIDSIQTYRSINRVRRVIHINNTYNNIFCIGINPNVVKSYQGDFDGDEMNVASLTIDLPPSENLTLVGDLRRSSFTVAQDGMYGLYCLVSRKVSLEQLIYDNVIQVDNEIRDMIEYIVDNINPDCSDFNDMFCEYMINENTHTESYTKYTHQDLILYNSRLYSEACNIMCAICDYCVIRFDRTDRSSIIDIIKSKCRPKMSTYDSIYNNIGTVTYTTPTNYITADILSNYSDGVSEEDYVHMCCSLRMQCINKAVRTAPEGDKVRLQCNYMSSIRMSDKVCWYNSTKLGSYVDDIRISPEEIVILENRYYTNTIDSTSRKLPYKSIDNLPDLIKKSKKSILHLGQRKLLMSEVEFLTLYYKPGHIIVYAGAAPGMHILTLLDLFPDAVFHLYDTTPFITELVDYNTKGEDRVIIYQHYLTPSMAAARYNHNTSNVLFMSDIRTRHDINKRVDNVDIMNDNQISLNILTSMNPLNAIMKFRLPFIEGTTVFVEGDIMLQCWNKVESAETRIICSRPYKTTYYDNIDYEQKLYYHNTIRPYPIEYQFMNDYLMNMCIKNNMLHHYDLYRESDIVATYINTYNVTEDYFYNIVDRNRSLSTGLSI